MKLSSLQALLGSTAALVTSVPGCAATSHQRLHQLDLKRHHSHGQIHARADAGLVEKRQVSCPFPNHPDLVPITPNAKNAGWAMSPDQVCEPNSYCPIACRPGMVMAQWDPNSKYVPGLSMRGGLRCDEHGKIVKPFPNEPYCVPGTGAVVAVNNCKSHLSWCQTVLPGNEAMLIPTVIRTMATVAVPGPDYWQSTAAHFYINPPGTGPEGCIWGDETNPIGNWSPYTAGANTVSDGRTFVTLNCNPKWQESTALKKNLPGFGARIECPDGGCTGMPCSVRASEGTGCLAHSSLAAVGAGGSTFCVVTVPAGKTAHIVLFEDSGTGGGDSGVTAGNSSNAGVGELNVADRELGVVSGSSKSSHMETPTPQPTTIREPTTTSSTSTLPVSSSTSSTTSIASPPPTTSIASTSSTTFIASTSLNRTTISTSSVPTTSFVPTTSSVPTTTSRMPDTYTKQLFNTTTQKTRPTVMSPGIFHENGTRSTSPKRPSSAMSSESSTETTSNSTPNTSGGKTGEAGRQQGNTAVAGLVVAFIAAACLF